MLLNSEARNIATRLYPNPAQRELAVEFDLTAAADWTVSIMDGAGRELMQRNVQANAGFNTVRMDLSTLASGLYTMQLRRANGDDVFREQFTKQ